MPATLRERQRPMVARMARSYIDPPWNSLHGDPRWPVLLREIGIAPEQLADIHFEVPIPAVSE